MEPHQPHRYSIAWVTASDRVYLLATAYLDEIHNRYTCPRSGADFTVGRAGPHHVVVAGASHQTRHLLPVADIIDSLVEEFPHVRVGFLVSADGTISHRGGARIGDVVVGVQPDSYGVLKFDADKSLENEQIFITGHSSRPSRVVRAAVKDLATSHHEWLKRLGNPSTITFQDLGSDKPSAPPPQPVAQEPFPRKIHHGVVGSSGRHLGNPALLDRLAAENGLICFETTAASLPVHLPFLFVCGVSGYYDISKGRNLDAAAQVAATYIFGLLRLLSLEGLVSEDTFASIFQHRRFDLDRPGFRLLRLEAGIGPVRCEIFPAYLDDDEALIPYEALSYTWGSNDLTDKVVVNGRVLSITANLLEALQHLRQPEQDRILWIDAICIDQGNLQERGHQVRHMSRIYTQAERVVIWLGMGTFEVKILMSSLNKLEREVPGFAFRHWPQDDPRWRDAWEKSQSSSKQDRLFLLDKQRCGLRHLMEKPWFRRVWILREVAVARTAEIGCSTGWAGTKSFALAPRLLGVEIAEHCQAVLDIFPGPSRKSSWWSHGQTLASLLWRFRWNQATDPRDRVYALLDLASDVNGPKAMRATYTSSEEAIVRDTFWQLFEEDLAVVHPPIRSITDLLERIPQLSQSILHRKVICGRQKEDLQRYLQSGGSVAKVDEFIMKAAIRRGLTILEVILDAPTQAFSITTPVLVDACANGSGKDNLKLLLDKLGGHFQLTHFDVQHAAEKGVDILQLVLDSPNSDIEITEGILLMAIRAGPDTLDLLLDRRGSDFRITESVVPAAIRAGPGTLGLLLDRRGSDVRITESVVLAAIHAGPDTLGLLLDRRGSDVRITGNIVLTAIRVGPDTLDLLLDKRGNVEITESVVLAAALEGRNALNLLRYLQRGDFSIIDDAILAAAHEGLNMLELLLDSRRGDFEVTKDAILAVAYEGQNALNRLLDSQRGDFDVTEGVILPAAHKGQNALELLLDSRRGNFNVTEDAILAAAHEGQNALNWLLDSRRGDFNITEDIILTVTQKGLKVLKLLLDLRRSDFNITDDAILTAAYERRNVLELLLDSRPGEFKVAKV